MSRRSEHRSTRGLLAELDAGGLTPETEAHLGRCPRCRGATEDLVRLTGDLSARNLVDPPEHLVARVTRMVPKRQPAPRRGIVEVLARLITGPGPAALQPVPGLRGGQDTGARERFEGEGLEVDVQLQPTPSGHRLLGLVQSRGASLPLLAWAEARGRCLGTAPVAEHGLFVLEGLPAGGFDIFLDLGARRLRIPHGDPARP